MKELSIRIRTFIDKYAVIRPDLEEGDCKFTSPDASELFYCAELLDKGIKPERCFSEWGSGGYKPYNDRKGREEHDKLVSEIYDIIKSK